MLTTFDLDEAAARAIRQGASGFLLKDADPEFLLAAIRTVHSGSAVIAASATRELFAHFADAAPRPVPPAYGELTEREREIFALAARGLSNAEIAGREFLSEATVKTHISRILAKLALRDRVQLVVFAFEHGLAVTRVRSSAHARSLDDRALRATGSAPSSAARCLAYFGLPIQRHASRAGAGMCLCSHSSPPSGCDARISPSCFQVCPFGTDLPAVLGEPVHLLLR